MAFSFAANATILQVITVLLWSSLECTKTKHRNFTKVFPDELSVEMMISLAGLVFAPCLLETLRSPTPPGVAFFKLQSSTF